jgi:hypothetical protein
MTWQFVLGLCDLWVLSYPMEHSTSSYGNIRSAGQESATILLFILTV